MSIPTFILVHSLSWADVGPPPSCPEGTKRIYDQGYKCVSEDGDLPGMVDPIYNEPSKDDTPQPEPPAEPRPDAEPDTKPDPEPDPKPDATPDTTPETAADAPSSSSSKGCGAARGVGLLVPFGLFGMTRRRRSDQPR
ncbi:MAG: hypothetical protein AAFV53_01435 [Myxococcota bacterium]